MTDPAPVFYLELELRLAPPLNDLMRMHWATRSRLAREIQGRVQAAKRDWPNWSCDARVETTGRIVRGKLCTKQTKTGGRKRRLCVVRYTAGALDETRGVDAIGGKLPTDELVTANVLRDDSEEWVTREGRTAAAPQRRGLLMVEVFEDEIEEQEG